jgi:hypothetical protein
MCCAQRPLMLDSDVRNHTLQTHDADRPSSNMTFTDMRKSTRVYGSFPVRLRWVNPSGRRLHAGTVVDNIGAGGLYMRLRRRMAEGLELFAVVWLVSGAAIAAKGRVIRVEKRPRGLVGVAVRFTRTRLVPPPEDGSIIAGVH